MSHVSVIIVGDTNSIAAALSALSRDKQIYVAACVSDIADIFGKLTEASSTVVLIDFNLVREAHYALLTELRRSHPKTKVMFLCDNADQSKLIDAFRYGASGYLESKDNEAFLAKAVRAVSNGEAWVPRHFVTQIVERLSRTTS